MSECKNLKECIDEIRKMANEFDMKVKVDEQGWQVEQERDELQAQVAVLRGELSADLRVFKSLNRYPFNCDEAIKRVKNALSTTPAEAAERVQKLVMTLEKIRDAKCISDRPGTYYKILADEALSEWRLDKCSS